MALPALSEEFPEQLSRYYTHVHLFVKGYF